VPTYRALLNLLCDRFEIVVYYDVAARAENDSAFAIRTPPFAKVPSRVRQFLFLFQLIRDHLRRPVHLVHAHSTFPTGWAAIVFRKLFSIPVIVSLDGAEGIALPEIDFGDLRFRKRIQINKWVINKADHVTCLTHFQLSGIIKNLGIQRQITVIPRGVDLDKFTRAEKREIGNRVIFLSVGYLSAVKDPLTLLKTFSILQKHIDCRLIHIGADYMNGSVQKMAADLGLGEKIMFHGPVDYAEISEYYKNADVLLHTALFESQAMVATEAMASGTLVCGSHVGLLSDLAGRCCITAPPGDAQALASAVLNLLKDPERVRVIRDQARLWAEENNIQKTAELYANIYGGLLKKMD
jgi:glycosyltransferase involved in cell wall biosynthesis